MLLMYCYTIRNKFCLNPKMRSRSPKGMKTQKVLKINEESHDNGSLSGGMEATKCTHSPTLKFQADSACRTNADQ